MKGIIVPLLLLFLINCSKDSDELTINLYGLTQDDIDQALIIHNNARSEVGVENLKWSSSLSKDASKWALQMAKEDRMYHSENDTRTGQGENLYFTSATDSLTSARNGSQLWYEEIKLYTYSPILSGENDFYEIGHYTQMVWNSTTEVGMAMAVSDSGKTYVVARYSPQGNFVGEFPY
jgi:hypothetical protein|tara:strand:+ start:966 stop:1499 length:534 start_codon:yes stop_codon:yes gene_type:complete